MPCLNEADTLGACIAKAQAVLLDYGIAGEAIVADNGSTDGSQGIACRLGAHSPRGCARLRERQSSRERAINGAPQSRVISQRPREVMEGRA
jgi:glycosyltransferase involved in cell wall biosynthesis